MKTAVSISDDLFGKAEKFAKKARISRSRLYSAAIEEYLENREKQKLIEKINKVCAKVDTSADPVVLRMALRSLPEDEWR
jgi:metal-responsive CopG/Arc/MetJ family transcriptional regulator